MEDRTRRRKHFFNEETLMRKFYNVVNGRAVMVDTTRPYRSMLATLRMAAPLPLLAADDEGDFWLMDASEETQPCM